MLKGRAENWEGDWGSGILAFRIVLCTTKTTRIQEWVSDTHAYNYVLAYIAIGSRRNMLLVVTLAKTRCKFYTRKLSSKVKAQNRRQEIAFWQRKKFGAIPISPLFPGSIRREALLSFFEKRDRHHFPLYMHKRFGLMDTSWVATAAVIVRIGRIKRGRVSVGGELSTLL